MHFDVIYSLFWDLLIFEKLFHDVTFIDGIKNSLHVIVLFPRGVDKSLGNFWFMLRMPNADLFVVIKISQSHPFDLESLWIHFTYEILCRGTWKEYWLLTRRINRICEFLVWIFKFFWQFLIFSQENVVCVLVIHTLVNTFQMGKAWGCSRVFLNL